MTNAPSSPKGLTRKKAWQVAGASLAGTTIEYYDFAIYGLAAALVFPKFFFPGGDPVLSSMAAFATFAVGFIARPVGGLIFGHFGDRIGRKPTLVITLVMMGIASALIGVLPTYQSVGIWAPILLVTLRILQGIAFGGEWGGAVLMAFEYAPPGRKAFFGSIPQVGPVAGALLGSGVFALITLMPEEAVLSWGWRVPFLFSVVLVVVGMLMRSKVSESPEFEALKEQGQTAALPFVDVLKKNPGSVVLIIFGYLGFGAYAAVLVTYMLSYGTKQLGIPASVLLTFALLASALQIPMMLLSGYMADRFGMRKVMVAGPILAIVGVYVLFTGVGTGQPLGIGLGYVIGQLCYSVCAGAQPALFAEAFPAPVRFTGMSLGYQVANVLGTGVTPLLATVIVSQTGSGYAVATYVAAVLVISLICLNLLVSKASRNTRERVIAPVVEHSSTAS
ncbi:MFS transporter [Arthrobacter sp. KN11-1C]|uniref:MFS transporter n=1 Tax=Arthrobacter sp. KN11-1C TaxID=3445774 RepID=UPI003F9FF461